MSKELDLDSLLNPVSAPAPAAPKGGKASAEIDLDSLLGGSKAEPVEQSGVLRRYVADPAISLLKGAIGVPEAGVGLLDIATGGHVGKALENKDGAIGFRPKEAKSFLDDLLSPEQKAENKKVDAAVGFVDSAKAMVSSPSTILHAGLESAPSFIPAGAAARLAGKVLPKIGGAVAAGIGEGAVSAGQTAEQVRQESADGLLTGKQAALSAGSGALTGVIGAVAGKVANKLGIGDINQLVAGFKTANPAVQKSMVRKLAEGFATEGALQELPQSAQEQIAQNVATGKPWDEGVGKAAAQGLLVGGAMGAAAAPMHGGHTESTPPPSTPGVAEEVAAATPAAQPAAPAGPSKSQQFAASAWAQTGGDTGGTTGLHATQEIDRATIALSLSRIKQHDGNEGLVQAINHLSAGNQELAGQLYDASEDKALISHGRKQLKTDTMGFVEANDGIRTDSGIVETQEQAATAPQQQTDTNAPPQTVTPRLTAQVAAVKSGLLQGAVVSMDAAEQLDLNGLQHAIATGPDGSQQLIVAKDEQTVQAAVNRANEVGMDQMGAEMFGIPADKAVVQRLGPNGEVLHESVVSPDQVGSVPEVPGSTTHVRPAADVLAERVPAAEAQVAEEGKAEPTFFSRTEEKAPAREVRASQVAPTVATTDLLDKVNNGYGLTGKNAIDPSSIMEVHPADKSLLRMAEAIKSAFGTTVTFVHLPQGSLMRKSGKVFNNFAGVAIPEKNRVFLNVASGHGPLHVLGHELVHVLEQQHPEAFAELEVVVLSRMRAKAARAHSERIQAAMNSESGKNSAGPIRQEVVAEALGEMAQDETLWAEVFDHIGAKPSLAQTLYKATMDVIAKLQRAFTSAGYVTGIRDVATVKKAAVSAFKEWGDQHAASMRPAEVVSTPVVNTQTDSNVTAPDKLAVETVPVTSPEAVELRKRLSVLKSLLECMG